LSSIEANLTVELYYVFRVCYCSIAEIVAIESGIAGSSRLYPLVIGVLLSMVDSLWPTPEVVQSNGVGTFLFNIFRSSTNDLGGFYFLNLSTF
jgi:hypothetical protein